MKGTPEIQMQRLFGQIQLVSRPVCYASTKFFAGKLGLSERQVYRYLSTLRGRGAIEVNTTRYFDPEKGRFTARRFISVIPKAQKAKSFSKMSTPKTEPSKAEPLDERIVNPNPTIPPQIREEYREMAEEMMKMGATAEAIIRFQEMEDRDRNRKERGLPTGSSYNYLERPTGVFGL